MSSKKTRKMGTHEYLFAKMHDYNKFYTSMLAIVCHVEKNIDFSLFKKAWNILFLRHPLLRATRKIKDKDYYFEFNASFNDIRIQHMQSTPKNHWKQILNETISESIDINQGFWKSILISSVDDSGSHIIFAADHTICDGISIAWLLGECIRVMMALEKQENVSKNSYPIPPAADEIIDYSYFSVPSYTQVPASIYHFDEACTPEVAQNQIVLRKIEKKDLITMVNKCKKHNVTFTHFMMAALAKSVCKIKNQKEGLFDIPFSISLRKFTKPKTSPNVLMDCASGNSIQFNFKSQQTLWELAARIKTLVKNSMKQYDLAGVFAALKHYADTDFYDWQIKFYDQVFAINYMIINCGRVDEAFQNIDPIYMPKNLFLAINSHTLFSPCFIMSYTLNDICYLNFNFAIPALKKERVEKIANMMIDLMCMQAKTREKSQVS